jgi:hypothetical protein
MDLKKELNDFLLEAGTRGKMTEESFLLYVNKYSVMKNSLSIKSLIQGNFYTFFYDSYPKKQGDYVNRRPVIFYHSIEVSVNKSIIKGIDILLLEPLDRKNFLLRINTLYSKIIDQNEGKPLSSRMPLRFDQDILETLMGGIKYKHAYKAYRLEKIKGLIDIPREEWKYLVYLDTKSIVGTTLNDIYNK